MIPGAPGPHARRPISARARNLSILLIAGSALLLRLWHLGARSLWIDEVLTVDRARALDSIGFLHWTPTHLLVRAAGEVFGFTEWSARVAPALIGAATIPVLYVLFRRFVDELVALVAAGLLAVCPWHVYWSQCSRGYAALLLRYAAGLLLLYEGLETRRLRLVLGAGVLMTVATLERRFTTLNASLTLGALVVLRGPWRSGFLRERGRDLAAVVATMGGIVLAYELVADLTNSEGMFEEFIEFRRIGPAVGSRGMLGTLVAEAGLPLLILAAAGTLRPGVWRSRDGRAVAVAAWIPVMTLLLLTRHVRVYARYAFVALPFLCLLAGLFLTRSLSSRRFSLKLPGMLAALWFAVVTAPQLQAHYAGQGRRLDWRPPLNVVRAQHVAGDVLYFPGHILARHYLGRDVELRWPLPRAGLAGRLPPGQRIWLLLPRDLPARFEAWLASGARRVEVGPAGAGQLWLYVAPARER